MFLLELLLDLKYTRTQRFTENPSDILTTDMKTTCAKYDLLIVFSGYPFCLLIWCFAAWGTEVLLVLGQNEGNG